jgi:hypothetical protein
MSKLVHKEITSCVNCPYKRILPEKIICALSTEYNPVLRDARTIPEWCPLPDAEE